MTDPTRVALRARILELEKENLKLRLEVTQLLARFPTSTALNAAESNEDAPGILEVPATCAVRPMAAQRVTLPKSFSEQSDL